MGGAENKISCQREDQSQPVIKAYLKPKCHPAGSDAVRRYKIPIVGTL